MNVKEMTWALARAQNKSSAGWYDVSCCSWEYHDARRYSVMFTSFRALTVLQSPPPRLPPTVGTTTGCRTSLEWRVVYQSHGCRDNGGAPTISERERNDMPRWLARSDVVRTSSAAATAIIERESTRIMDGKHERVCLRNGLGPERHTRQTLKNPEVIDVHVHLRIRPPFRSFQKRVRSEVARAVP